MRNHFRNYLLGVLALVALCVSGCATLVAETPGQKWYAAKAEYAVVLGAAVAYAESPAAHPAAVAAMMSVHAQAETVFALGDALIAPDGSIADAAALFDLIDMLSLLRMTLRTMLLQITAVP